MSVTLAFLATLEAKRGKGEELGKFLKAGRELAASEEETVTRYAFRIDETHYGIFDTFATEEGRQAHIAGHLAEAPYKAADELLQASRRSRPLTSSPSSDRPHCRPVPWTSTLSRILRPDARSDGRKGSGWIRRRRARC
jgi:quinol monooxygenase YgiN